MSFDVLKIREDFPILSREVHNKPLIYLDNGYSRGETVEDMVAEIKSIVKDTELGAMDWTIDQIVAEWKADRGLV